MRKLEFLPNINTNSKDNSLVAIYNNIRVFVIGYDTGGISQEPYYWIKNSIFPTYLVDVEFTTTLINAYYGEKYKTLDDAKAAVQTCFDKFFSFFT